MTRIRTAASRANSPSFALRVVWSFFWPLALSGLMMSAVQPIVQAGLARLESPELILAAYGVAFYVAMMLEAPVLMFLPVANALVDDRRSYRLTRNMMFIVNGALTIFTGAVALWTPLYDLVFLRLLGIPPDVALAARPCMIIFIPRPALIGIRRYYQGILVHFRRTQVVSWGSGARLVAMVVPLVCGVAWFPDHGIIVGGIALMAGVVADMLMAVLAARNLLVQHVLPAVDPGASRAGLKAVGFFAFFLPLAMTGAMRVVGRPLILSGIARGHNAVLALAAFPVALATVQLMSGFLTMLQQVAVALARDGPSMVVVRRFTGLIAAGCTALLVLTVATPLGTWYHGRIIGLEEPVLGMANASLILLLAMPLLTAFQAYYQGLMIRAGSTVSVNLAAVANLVLLLTAVHLAATRTAFPGHLIGGVVLPVALAVEVGLLNWRSHRIRQELAGKKHVVIQAVPPATDTR